MTPGAVRTSPAVQSSIRSGQPVVALETAVLTHGLPRTPLPAPACFASDSPLHELLGIELAWDDTMPANRQLGAMLERVVKHAGAVPAFIGVIDGALQVGLDEDPRALPAGSRGPP